MNIDLKNSTALTGALSERPSVSAAYHAGDSPDGSSTLDMKCWLPRTKSADLDILPSKALLEGRAGDLIDNDGLTAGAEQIHVDNLVGEGLRLLARPDYKMLGQTEEWARELGSKIESGWRSWVYDDRNLVDVRETVNWPGLQAQAVRSWYRHGEMFGFLEAKKSPHTEFVSRIRLVDPDRVSNPAKGFNIRNKDVRNGIEYDKTGTPIAVYVSSEHPRFYLPTGKWRTEITWTRVPVWKKGRRVVFHAFDPVRAEQSRGVTLMASVVRATKMLDRVADATLQAALMQTIFAAVVKSNANYGEIMEVLGREADKTAVDALQDFMEQRAEYYSENRIKVDGASVVHLLPDEDLQLTAAKSTNPEIGEFLDAMRLEVARGNGITLEQLTGDFRKTNYSSSQMSNVITGKTHAGRRVRVVNSFAQWVYGLWLEEFFARRNVLPRGITWAAARGALSRAEWVGPPKVDADPVKSATAAGKRLENGTTTLAFECGALGHDWEEVLEQRAKELVKMKDLGLFDLMAELTASTQAQSEPSNPNAAAATSGESSNGDS